jgi:2-dehydropantoate 2-reductase
MELITVETAEVARGYGIELPYDDPVQMVEDVARKTADNYSSMYIDMHRSGPTEIDAISGAIVRVGEKINVPTYFNKMMWMLVKARTE